VSVRRASTVALLALSGLLPACAPRATQPPPPAPAAAERVGVVYREPADPAHRKILEEARGQRFLERVAEVLGVVQLPKPLTLSLSSCDGTANAWYDPERGTVTLCYEYLAEFRQLAAAAHLEGAEARDAANGPAVFVLLHESGHAVFDLLQVPILGHEEDAADTFAAVLLLKLGRDVAFHVLRGAAWSYGQEAAVRTLGEGDFADQHGLDAQRYYNLLCLAYGSDPKYFAPAVQKSRLPEDRAEGCREEYHQALFAVQKLIAPSVDPRALERLRVKHGGAWDLGR